MADTPIHIDLDTVYRKGPYLLFKTGEQYALLSRQQAGHLDVYDAFKRKVEQEKTPELQSFNPVTKDHVCGAGLYRIDKKARTITFFGKSDKPRFKKLPLGPLEDFCNEITTATGLLVRIDPHQDWWELWIDPAPDTRF